MPEVTIIPVSNRKQQKQFVELPWSLYADDPNWTPPLRQNLKELLNYRKHPFYENAKIQTFLAYHGNEVVGRVAAIIDHGHNEYHNEKRGMVGFFESIDDVNVSNALFDAARDWFAEQDIQLMRGPLNPSMNYECGLLVEGFDAPACFMMTYNPEYYGKLFEAYGFAKSQDLYAYYGHVDMLKTLDPKIKFVLDEATKRFNVKVRPAKKRKFHEDIAAFFNIYNLAVQGNWGYVPMTEVEIQHVAASLKLLIVHDLCVIAEVDEKIVGIVFGLLDYNPIIKKIDGRLFPFGFLKLLFGRRKVKRIRLISTNVLPEYQRWGMGVVLTGHLLPLALDFGIEDCELSWVLESNQLSRGTIERGGAKRIKTYRIYDFEPKENGNS